MSVFFIAELDLGAILRYTFLGYCRAIYVGTKPLDCVKFDHFFAAYRSYLTEPSTNLVGAIAFSLNFLNLSLSASKGVLLGS